MQFHLPFTHRQWATLFRNNNLTRNVNVHVWTIFIHDCVTSCCNVTSARLATLAGVGCRPRVAVVELKRLQSGADGRCSQPLFERSTISRGKLSRRSFGS